MLRLPYTSSVDICINLNESALSDFSKYLRDSSSKIWVPIIFVLINSADFVIELSTCDSAAKLIIKSGENDEKIFLTSFWLVISVFWKS